jgi:hypothetical protein
MTFIEATKKAALTSLLLALASRSALAAPPISTDTTPTRTVSLIPFNDPSPVARQRFRDIDDRPFSPEFSTTFRYTPFQVTLTYRTGPNRPYFMGHIEARGLKPNFSYQLKLAGKPKDGYRGWGEMGDDSTNEALGRVTRWWNDLTQMNSSDRDFYANYENAEPTDRQTIYGYDYMGEFVTDANGNASLDFNGAYAYHVAWQDKQVGSKDKYFGDFEIGSLNPPYYGYGKLTPVEKVRLWYEWEGSRAHNVRLPAGTYNCRFLLTEESFHSIDPNSGGGTWANVLASEDFDLNGRPDADPNNDIVFTIR